MATLSSSSTAAEVWAEYDDNVSYEEDGSHAKALAFVTACRILRNWLPLSAGRGSQTERRARVAEFGGTMCVDGFSERRSPS